MSLCELEAMADGGCPRYGDAPLTLASDPFGVDAMELCCQALSSLCPVGLGLF